MSLCYIAMYFLKPASRLFTNQRKKSKGLLRKSRRDKATASSPDSAKSNSNAELHDPPPAYKLADDTEHEKCHCGTDLTMAQEISSLRAELEEVKWNLRLFEPTQKPGPRQVTPEKATMGACGEVDIFAVSEDITVTLQKD